MNKSREQFEAWFTKTYPKSRNGVNTWSGKNDGDYINDYAASHWRAWQASRAALCPKCGGTGMADSGGVQPWGEPIEIPCDCPFGDDK